MTSPIGLAEPKPTLAGLILFRAQRVYGKDRDEVEAANVVLNVDGSARLATDYVPDSD